MLGVIASRHRGEAAFVATYNIATNSETLILPVVKDYEVDWGDSVTTTSGNSHTYTNSGIYTVKMYGVVDDFTFNNSGDRVKILTVENWGGFENKLNENGNFFGCSNLSTVPNNLKKIENLGNFFRGCSVLDSDVSEFDISGISSSGSLAGCFLFANSFTNRVDEWDYSNVKGVGNFISNPSYPYQNYDLLLIKWDSDPSLGGLDVSNMTNKNVNMYTIQYSSVGAAAHASLITKGLVINDGGQNAF